MKNSQNLVALLVLIVVGGGLFVYKNYFSEAVVLETGTIAQESANAEKLLLEIESTSFDREFFNSPTVNTLTNFYVVPEEQAAGRSNPFTTISGSGNPPQSIPLNFSEGSDSI